MDSNPIICIGLDDEQTTEEELEQLREIESNEDAALMRKCLYVLHTLDQEETVEYDNLRTPVELTAFLSTRVDDIEAGRRPVKIYHPPKELTPSDHQNAAGDVGKRVEEKRGC